MRFGRVSIGSFWSFWSFVSLAANAGPFRTHSGGNTNTRLSAEVSEHPIVANRGREFQGPAAVPGSVCGEIPGHVAELVTQIGPVPLSAWATTVAVRERLR